MTYKSAIVAFVSISYAAWALPIRREVPQEHSHEPFITSVRTSLNINNPDNILDPIFALLGNAAATQGLGQISDPDCLQQATADQAFTNAKAAGDVQGQVDALIFRALERNSAQVGATTAQCTIITAVNPEIAAIQQHQDPASTNAAAVNKAIVLELAKQIAAVGGNPQDALKSGTFTPGDVNDPTAKGNTCDDANDPNGCIFTQNLLVADASADEIASAAGGTVSAIATTAVAETASVTNVSPSSGAIANSTSTTSMSVKTGSVVAIRAASTSSSTSGNLQTFTGALGGISAPAVTQGGRGFNVEGSDSFLNLSAALGRSCDIQHNECADAANSGNGISAGQCDQQNNSCQSSASS